MDETTFYVETDDITALKLSFWDIDQIMKSPHDSENSPLSLDFRVLPDLSVLKRTKRFGVARTLEALAKQSCVFDLSCYEYTRHRGSHFNSNTRSNYEFGPLLWSISATYIETGYLNKGTISQVLDYLYLGQSQSGIFSMSYVTVNDPNDRLVEFANYYFKIREPLAQPQTWIDLKLGMRVKCPCDHVGFVNDKLVSSLLSKKMSLDDIESRLRCDECGLTGEMSVLPVYTERTPKSLLHRTGWVPCREMPPTIKKPARRESELGSMYNALGGDGTSPVYLGDGAYLSSSGKVLDD
ncbi:hypothetical protein [Microvirga splendida]|uniref:Uncharacterized protein n=1 Tax=Microvirga splendida TaxID=2795727 RepID=A0ABS0Y8F1_9HYPH|nr:hypothetical protein [Microvirga splendida]MBJ6128558.1 hypothetical protein [Microvirga splendida]